MRIQMTMKPQNSIVVDFFVVNTFCGVHILLWAPGWESVFMNMHIHA